MEIRVRSQLDEDLADILNQVQERTDSAIAIAQQSTKLEDELAILENEEIQLTKRQKMYYINNVQPQLDNIYRLVAAGVTMVGIAEALGVPINTMYEIKKQIPEVDQMFMLGRQQKADLAMESLYMMSRDRVYEEEELDRNGRIVKVQKWAKGSYQAAKYITEREGPEAYRKKEEEVVKFTVPKELMALAKALTVEDLNSVVSDSEIIDAEFEEKDDE